MAAANESQGLKIAVAIFVTLTVVLAVSTYFAYTSYSQADAKYTKAESDLQSAKKAQDIAVNQVDSLRKEIGTKAEEPDSIKAEMKAEDKKIDDVLGEMITKVNAMVQKAQADGATGTELEEAKAKVQQISAAYRSEPNKTYISRLARLAELVQNLSMLTTQVSLNYVDVKRNLESSNTVNDKKLNVESEALAAAKKDLEAEHKKHAEERDTILAKIDQYTSENAKMQVEITNLQARIRKMEDDYTKSLALSQQTVREQRARLELKETVLERPDGEVTFVDYSRGEVHANLTRATGARPQMQFAIFDASSPGLPTDKPKGTIELVRVGDRESVARIIKTNNNSAPIHRRFRLLGRLVAQRADAVRPDRQDRH